jgi:hypothetical protein
LRSAKTWRVATLLDALIPNDVARGRLPLLLGERVCETALAVDGGTGVLAADVGDPLPANATKIEIAATTMARSEEVTTSLP